MKAQNTDRRSTSVSCMCTVSSGDLSSESGSSNGNSLPLTMSTCAVTPTSSVCWSSDVDRTWVPSLGLEIRVQEMAPVVM